VIEPFDKEKKKCRKWNCKQLFSYFQGVAVGCGWQAFVAYVNVGCYYIIGLPLGAVLGFKFNLGAKV
jgi:Na+-driven multidrug efflux pump